jgi:thioredoxin-related protein
MKKSLLLITLAVAFCNISFGQKPSADKILSAAYQTAAKDQKNVLIIFHASWCSWCKKMDASINNPSCKKMFEDNFVIVHLDVNENDKNKNLENPGADVYMKKFGGEKAGLPFFVVTDEHGELIADSYIRGNNVKMGDPGQNMGCPATAEEVAGFCKILQTTSHLTEAQLKIITKVFRKNEQK